MDPTRFHLHIVHSRRFLVAVTVTLALVVRPAVPSNAQPADEDAAAMNARLAAAAVSVNRVGPTYLYPPPTRTPGFVNENVTQANIHQTICVQHWTASIRPPASYTNQLKQHQLLILHARDMNLSHYEEDHLIPLEIGGHPREPRNLWPEQWGTPGRPLTSRGRFPPNLVGAKTKDAVENRLHREVCQGNLILRQAQFIIATDWFRYFRDKVLE